MLPSLMDGQEKKDSFDHLATLTLRLFALVPSGRPMGEEGFYSLGLTDPVRSLPRAAVKGH